MYPSTYHKVNALTSFLVTLNRLGFPYEYSTILKSEMITPFSGKP